jgi:hypothetical protein
MRTVKIWLQPADLSREMGAMREWLDQTGYQPRRFTCDQEGEAVVVFVDFMDDAQGEEFAARFRKTPS